MSDDEDDDDPNNGTKLDMVTRTNIHDSSSSSSDGESNNTVRTKVRAVSFNDEPKIFIFHTSDPDSDLDTTSDEDEPVEKQRIVNSVNDEVGIQNQAKNTGWVTSNESAANRDGSRAQQRSSSDDDTMAIDKELTSGPTASDVLSLQERWERYETEKQNLDEMEETLQKRRTVVSEQEKELEEYRAYLERRHKTLTKKEEDLCVLQDELEDLSDLLKEKKEKIARDEEMLSEELSTHPDEEVLKEMKQQLQDGVALEKELKDKLKTQEELIEQKKATILDLEKENEKLRGKMKRLELKLSSEMTSMYGSSMLERQTSFSAMVSTIPSEERAGGRHRMESSSFAAASSYQAPQQHNVHEFGSSSTLSQRFSPDSFTNTPSTSGHFPIQGEQETPASPDSISSEYSMYLQPLKKQISEDLETCSDEGEGEGEENKAEDGKAHTNMNSPEYVSTQEVYTPTRKWPLFTKSSNVSSKTCMLM